MESFRTSIIEVHNVGFLNKEEIRKLVKEFGEIVAIDHSTTSKANYTIKFLSEIDFDNLNKQIEQKVLSIVENPGVKYEDPSSRVIMKIINHRYKEKDNDLIHKFKYPFTSNANIYIDFIIKITTNKKKTNNTSKNNCFNFELTGRRARTLKREKHMRFTNEGTYNSFIVNYKNFIRHRKRLGRKKKYSKNMQESDMINSLLGQANILYLNNNLNEAINKLKEIIKLNSEIPEAYHLLNLIYSQNGNFDKSLEMLMLYAQTKKNDKELWIKCASLYENSNNFSKAIYCYTRLQRLQKDNHLILIKKAMLCEEDKHLKRAALNYLRLYYINKDLLFEASNKRIRVKPTVNRHLKKIISKDTNSNNSDSDNEVNNDVLSHYDAILQQTYKVFSNNISRENILLMIKIEQSNNLVLSNLLNYSGFKESFQFLSEKYSNNDRSFNLFLYVMLLLLKDKKRLHVFLISLKVVLVNNESVMTLIENSRLDNTESFKDLTFFLFHKFSSIPINSNSFILFYLLFLIALNIEVEDQKILFSNIRLQLSDKDQTMKDIVLLFYLLIDLNDTYTRYFNNNTVELKEKYTIIMNDCVSFFKNLLSNLVLTDENAYYFTFLISIYISTIKYHHIFFVYNKKTLIDNFQNLAYSNSLTIIMDNLIDSNFNKNFGNDIHNNSNNQLKLIESPDKKSTEFNCDYNYTNYLDKPIYLNRKILNTHNPNDNQTPNTNFLKRKRKIKILSKPSFKFKLSSKKPKLLLLNKSHSNITFNDNEAIIKQNDNRNKNLLEIKRKIEKTLSLINSSIDQYSKLDFIKEIESKDKLNLLNNIITIEIQLLDIKDEILDLYLSDPQSQKYRFIINGNCCEIVDINEVSVDDMLELEINHDNNTVETMIFNRKSTHLKQNLNDIKFMGIVKLVEKQFRSINNIVKFISLSKFLELIIETVENSTFIIKDKELIINEDVNELKMIQNLSFSVMSFYNKTNESEFFKLIVISIITSLNLNTHQKSFKLIKKFMHIFKCNNNSNLFCVFWDNILKLRNYTKYKPMIYKLSKTTTYENNCLMKFILSNLYLVSGSHSISNKLISDLIRDYKIQNPIFFFSLSINYLFLSLSRNNLQKEKSIKLALILFNKYYDSRITSNFTESNYNKGRFYQFLCLDSKAINCYTNVINKYGYFATVEDKNKDINLKSIYNTSLIYKKQGNNWKAHDLIMNNIII